MKILIADDQEAKQISLSDFIKSNFKNCEIVHSYSFKGTRDKIIKNNFDLILLDMTMPSYDALSNQNNSLDGKNRPLAGSDIIQTMAYRQIFSSVIVVTQFDVFGRHYQITSIEDIIGSLMNDYPNIVKGYVLWDYQAESWKNKLLAKINGIKQ